MKKQTSLKTKPKIKANHKAAIPKPVKAEEKPKPEPKPEPRPPQPEFQTRVKGDHQPPTKVGLDDERSKTGNVDEPREDKWSITDQVMKEQSKYHIVQRV